jgi:nicotinate-nucleotide adenylyltransferase
MSKKRLEHTLRVTNLALDICECTNIKLFKKAFLAAMYHDIAKEFSDQQIKKLVGNFHSKCYPTIHTMHGIASAEYARKFLNIKDREVLNAIANHVIPPKNPSELDMIIYCADKLEPNRTKDDIKDRLGCIALAKKNLKVAFTKVYNETCAHYN